MTYRVPTPNATNAAADAPGPYAHAPGAAPAPMSETRFHADIRKLMLHNAREGYSGLLRQHYCYIAPAPESYPYQWFWDTCFHLFILTRLGEYDWAKRNLRSLFAMQEENGFVGHMIFWKQPVPQRRTDIMQARPSLATIRPHMSALIQPTFAAIALQRLCEACGDRVYLGEMYARIRRYHDWLANTRDFDGDGLLTIISPFESGMDWKASYDSVLGYAQRKTPQGLYLNRLFWKGVGVDFSNFVRRYDLPRIRERARFLVKDVGVNVIYACDLRAMEQLAEVAGDDPAIFRARRQRVIESMMAQMYDEADAAFYDVAQPGSRKLRTLTPTALFPAALEEIPDAVLERALAAHFRNKEEFDVPVPIPSVSVRDPAFFAGDSKFLWRGPTWAMINWFLYHALRRRGYDDYAQSLRNALASAVAASGFHEYYNPFTGAGLGARGFTPTGLLIDMT